MKKKEKKKLTLKDRLFVLSSFFAFGFASFGVALHMFLHMIANIFGLPCI